jgi:hypothetical protein
MAVDHETDRELTTHDSDETSREPESYEPPVIVKLGSLCDVLGKSGGRPDNAGRPTRP